MYLDFLWRDQRGLYMYFLIFLQYFRYSFFKNFLPCVKVQFLQQESKQTFPENLKFEKRDYHFQTEVVLIYEDEFTNFWKFWTDKVKNCETF